MPAAEPSVDKILANFSSIARSEHIIHGSYIDSASTYGLTDHHPICNGHAACAVGSLYVAGRVASELVLDMVDGSREYRDRRLRRRPNLREAYRLLDEQAARTAKRLGVDLAQYDNIGTYVGELEQYFEGYLSGQYFDEGDAMIADPRTRDELVRLAKAAREQHRRNRRRAEAQA